MRYESNELENQAALQTAARMCAAIRTAPKAAGVDTIKTMVLTGDEKGDFANAMEKFCDEELGENFVAWYYRDAENIRKSDALILVGAERKYRGAPKCGFCGFADCGECKKAGGNCAMAYVDLGVALSSAAIVAANDMVDNRIMFSAGKVANSLYVEDNTIWMGIPISVAGKNIFFDRKPGKK